MKQMLSVIPQKQCPPAGTYPFNITEATPGFTAVKNTPQGQKGGHSKISLAMEIAEGEHAGYPAFDELGTDGGTGFGAASKKRLRQLDVPGLDSDAEIPDEVIAGALLNRRVLAICEREQRENAAGEKQFEVNEQTGTKVALYRLRIIGYVRQATGVQTGVQQGLPLAPQAPQGYPQMAQAPQYAQAPAGVPGGWPQQPQQVAQGFAPPAPGAVPGGYAPQAPVQGFPQVAPPPGWGAAPNGAQQPQAPQGQPQFPGAPGMQPPR